MRKKGPREFRSSKGLSLIEMLTAMMLTGFIAAATCDMIAALSLVSLKADYQLSSSLQCKRAMDALGQNIRSAHKIDLNSSTQSLRLYIPVISFRDKGGADVPYVQNGMESCDKIEYIVLPDSNKPGSGEFILQRTLTELGPRDGLTTKPSSLSLNQPQTIVKGIVGPLSLDSGIDPIAANYRPQVFTYLQTIALQNTYPQMMDSSPLVQPQGVAVQLEIQPSENPNKNVRSTTFGLRSEFYCRSTPL